MATSSQPSCRTLLVALAPCVLAACTLVACSKSTPPSRDPVPADGALPSGSAPAPTASTAPVAAPAADDGGAPDAAAPEAAGTDDAGAAPPLVADNKVTPTEGAELAERARGLFEAIVKNEPERAEAFWFPRAPFIPLKDVKDPGKYWDQLHKTYVHDVHALHKKRKSWDGAELVGFEGWSHPKWVPPGDEANKIGYYRAFHGKLHYKIGGAPGEIDVHTIITWQGRWYVTHLRKFKK
jgi:hypothetical protein